MTHNQQYMVERLSELERVVEQLTGRIGELQRELRQSAAFPERRQGGSCLRTLFGAVRSAGTSRPPIRENRRVQRHEHCLS
ncbi:MAG: hypothetical protein KF814_03445 [Nitrospiraceae bacterium]|nr:hypothetical protein [Nitrospiraceae bacterium]